MRVLIFEDDSFSNLYPLSLLRGVFDIKCGVFSLKEKIENALKEKYKVLLHCRKQLRNYLAEVYTENKINQLSEDDYLFLNGRIVFPEKTLKYFANKFPKDSLMLEKDLVIAAKISKEKIGSFKEKIEGAINDSTFSEQDFQPLNLNVINHNSENKHPQNDLRFYIIKYPWDTIRYLDDFLRDDLKYLLRKKKTRKKTYRASKLINSKNVHIAKKVKVHPDVVLDAKDGGIFIDENAIIEPFSFIKGPVYIGKNCVIKSGTKMYGPCSIGKYSKVSGEITNSIFHSYVNKQHDGFFGHSYVSEFVNIGADTVTSNLKNNYSKIKVFINSRIIDTGMQFLGSIVGDHSKFGINTMINTGTISGIFSNIAGGGFFHKEIKSFSWNILGRETTKYNIDLAIGTAKVVMQRRNLDLSEAFEKLIRNIYNKLD
ncbi:MAG: hypothetical protein ISS16_03110 [Ignavibacteria bacterium]|nr:hypothetical protein [Ignavibacteria bacterium]